MSTAASACERLAQSRERLRQVMCEEGPPPDDAHHHGHTTSSSEWSTLLKTTPGSLLLFEVFQSWWARQPLRLTLQLATQATNLLVQPVAQRHPYRLVMVSAAVGGLLVLARPWRWLPTSALFAGLLPQLLTETMKHMPRQAASDAGNTRPLTHRF